MGHDNELDCEILNVQNVCSGPDELGNGEKVAIIGANNSDNEEKAVFSGPDNLVKEEIETIVGTDSLLTEDQEVIGSNAAESFYRVRGLKTSILLVCVILVGMASSTTGPSYVDLEQYLFTSTRMISMVTPLASCGSLAASLVMLLGILGGLAPEYSMAAAMIWMAVNTMLWTTVRSIYWFLVLAVIQGFSSCIAVLQCQPYCLQLWANHRFQKPVIHSIHALISLGLSIGPFIITPFLAEHDPISNNVDVITRSDVQESPWYSLTAGDTHLENTTNEYNQNLTQESRTNLTSVVEYSGRIKYAFVTIGLPLLIPAILFFLVSLKSGVPILRVNNQSGTKVQEKSESYKLKQISRLDRNLLLALTFVFYTFNAVTEFVPQTYFTLYVTSVLHWKTPQRTLINSAFHGSLCIGRILGIPLSGYLKQRTMLACNVSIILLASILLLLSTLHDAIMWMAASLMGLGLSTVFGAILLWLSESVQINNRIMGAIVISSSIGAMLGPLITGQLFAAVSPMCLAYVVFGAAILDVFIYLALCLLEKRRFRKLIKMEDKNGYIKAYES